MQIHAIGGCVPLNQCFFSDLKSSRGLYSNEVKGLRLRTLPPFLESGLVLLPQLLALCAMNSVAQTRGCNAGSGFFFPRKFRFVDVGCGNVVHLDPPFRLLWLAAAHSSETVASPIVCFQIQN